MRGPPLSSSIHLEDANQVNMKRSMLAVSHCDILGIKVSSTQLGFFHKARRSRLLFGWEWNPNATLCLIKNVA